MAISWRSKGKKLGWMLLLSFGVSGVLTGLFRGGDYLSRDYFHTSVFSSEVWQYMEQLSTFELNPVSREEAQQRIVVTQEDIEEHRYRYGDLAGQLDNIRSQYEQKIAEAQADGNTDLEAAYTAERDKKLTDITNNFKDDEYVRPKVIAEKEKQVTEYYDQLKTSRPEFRRYSETFQYYFTDSATGKVYTNVEGETSLEALLKQKNLFVQQYPGAGTGDISLEEVYIHLGNDEVMRPIFKQTAGTVRGAIMVPAGATGSLMESYKQYAKEQTFFWVHTACSAAALLLAVYINRRKRIIADFLPEQWNRYYGIIPADIRWLVFFATGIIACIVLLEGSAMFYPPNQLLVHMKNVIWNTMAAAIVLTLCLGQGVLLRRQLKSGSVQAEWQQSLMYKLYQGGKKAFLVRSLGTQMLLLMGALGAVIMSALIIAAEPAFTVLYMLLAAVVGTAVAIFLLRHTGSLSQIIRDTEELAAGQLNRDLAVSGTGALAGLAASINTLRKDVSLSQRAQAKSERLKTELITNVSHDLRTPLTSIITYTELLKTPNLTADEQAAYVEIIDRKSKRLKVLIDDLFEASKMASGNIELTKERIDLVQLLQQALGEYDEQIQSSTLQFRVSHEQPHLYAYVDGPRMWRVFDNIISNILKYSLAHTRVYITAVQEKEQIILSFKNISKYELGGSTDELLERFKRGDASRHTEGSGLGLAIAKSIVDLHGGECAIEADGDLFKITIRLAAAL